MSVNRKDIWNMLVTPSIRGESQMKIVIIGGFLGGGKTTVLNHLLAESLKESLKPANGS